MNDMVERVAIAIAGAEYGDGYDRPWEPFCAHARAAIEAMREPSEGMIHQGGGASDHPSLYMGGPSAQGKLTATRIWRSMIDHILNVEG